ncbi:hypothetical protein INR49_026749 [Caranx melampygus]|nr:hypothetical protein INR49_026749 [Caranx melampygus]
MTSRSSVGREVNKVKCADDAVESSRQMTSTGAASRPKIGTCSGDKTLRVYDTGDFSELPFSPLSGHGYSVHCCASAPAASSSPPAPPTPP